MHAIVSNMALEGLLAELKEYFPIFPVNSNQIKIILTPSEFYETIIEGVHGSDRRIYLASLYLGAEEEEKRIIGHIQDRLSKNSGLAVYLHLDHHRGRRPDITGESSASLLAALQPQKRVTTHFYQSPLSRGWLREHLVPHRWNEIFGLSHMKVAIFDDNVLITGANLSKQYFTNRADRYILVKDAPELANYFAEVIESVRSETGLQELRCRFKDGKELQSGHRQDSCDTFIVPSLQMNQHGITQDERLLNILFSWLREQRSQEVLCSMATGYFNPAPQILSLLASSHLPWKILTSSPEANGFYASPGLSGYIPDLYRSLEYNFLISTSGMHRQIYEYFRKAWTFHGKGLWIEDVGKWTITTFGSTNFGMRSFERDLEAQIMLLTRNNELIEAISAERAALFNYSRPVTISSLSRPSPLISLASRLFSSFF